MGAVTVTAQPLSSTTSSPLSFLLTDRKVVAKRGGTPAASSSERLTDSKAGRRRLLSSDGQGRAVSHGARGRVLAEEWRNGSCWALHRLSLTPAGGARRQRERLGTHMVAGESQERGKGVEEKKSRAACYKHGQRLMQHQALVAAASPLRCRTVASCTARRWQRSAWTDRPAPFPSCRGLRPYPPDLGA